MDELRKSNILGKKLNIDPNDKGRAAITGKDDLSVWDYLCIKESKSEKSHTKYPHLTFAIEHDRALATLIIPHGIKATFRRNITNLGFENFCGLMEAVCRNLDKQLGKESGAIPYVIVVQRRYPSQRSQAIIDAKIEYDLRTAFERTEVPKYQPEWLKATFDAFTNKKSNLQLQVGAIFPYRSCKATKNSEILDYISKTWLSCKPILDVLLKQK
jgi:hypothetical protein